MLIESRASRDRRFITRVSNLKYESVHIDSKTVVFIRTNPGKKGTTDDEIRAYPVAVLDFA